MEWGEQQKRKSINKCMFSNEDTCGRSTSCTHRCRININKKGKFCPYIEQKECPYFKSKE